MTINPHPRSLSAELVEYYRALPPATIGHIVDEGFVDTAIRPIFKRSACVGTAVTLKLPTGDLSLTRAAIWTRAASTCRSSAAVWRSIPGTWSWPTTTASS